MCGGESLMLRITHNSKKINVCTGKCIRSRCYTEKPTTHAHISLPFKQQIHIDVAIDYGYFKHAHPSVCHFGKNAVPVSQQVHFVLRAEANGQDLKCFL